MPVITIFPFGTLTLSKKTRSMLAGCPFRKDSFLSGFLFPRKSILECWIVANRFGFLWILACYLQIVFHSALFSSRTLTFRRPLYAVSNLCFSFDLRLALGCSSAESRTVQDVLHEKRNASHDFVFEERTKKIFSLVLSLDSPF